MSNTTSSLDSSSQLRGELPPPAPALDAGATELVRIAKPAPARTFDLGDDDLVADGGTQIMQREPGQGSLAPASAHPSSLAALTAALEAKKLEGKPVRRGDDAARPLEAGPVVGKKPPRVQPTLPSRVATAIGPAGLPPASKTEPDLEDLAFERAPEKKIDRTQPFRRGLFGRGGVAPTLESPVWQPRPSAPPYGSHVPADRRPTSIAPISVDVSRSMPPSWSHPPMSFAAPKKSHAPVIAAAIAGCIALCAMAVVGLVALEVASDRASEDVTGPTFAVERGPHRAPPPAPVPSFALPSLDHDDTRVAPVPPLLVEPLDATGTPTSSVGALPAAPAAGKTSTGSRSIAIGAGEPAPSRPASKPAKAVPPVPPVPPIEAAEPAPPPVTTAPPPPPAPPPPRVAPPAPTTGVVQVSPSLMTVMVDGDYRRVNGGRIVVTCGRHKINAGRGTQVVDVPCGGVASVP